MEEILKLTENDKKIIQKIKSDEIHDFDSFIISEIMPPEKTNENGGFILGVCSSVVEHGDKYYCIEDIDSYKNKILDFKLLVDLLKKHGFIKVSEIEFKKPIKLLANINGKDTCTHLLYDDVRDGFYSIKIFPDTDRLEEFILNDYLTIDEINTLKKETHDKLVKWIPIILGILSFLALVIFNIINLISE